MNRVYHTWDKWECYPAGFYENSATGKKRDECEEIYRELLANPKDFERSLTRVISEWRYSCEHYLTNEKMNRIAWLGQASLCISMGIPSCFRSGYFLLSKQEQKDADIMALKYLNIWLESHGHEQTNLEGAGVSSHANIY